MYGDLSVQIVVLGKAANGLLAREIRSALTRVYLLVVRMEA